MELLREFVDCVDHCSYDHHGYCQEHGGEAPCHVERAMDMVNNYPKFLSVQALLDHVSDRMPNVEWDQNKFDKTVTLHTHLIYIDNTSEPGPKIAGLYDYDYAAQKGWLNG